MLKHSDTMNKLWYLFLQDVHKLFLLSPILTISPSPPSLSHTHSLSLTHTHTHTNTHTLSLSLSLIIKPTRCTNFSNSFLDQNSTCFGEFLCPSSGVFHCTHSNGMSYKFADSQRAGSERNCSSVPIPLASCQQTCMTHTTAVCTVKNS